MQVGRYLDPFIDGDVEPQLYEKRSAGLFMTRLERAWTDPAVSTQELEMRAKCGASNKLPVSPAVALTAYTSHCITKMNCAWPSRSKSWGWTGSRSARACRSGT